MEDEDDDNRILGMTEAELRAEYKRLGYDWDREIATAKSCAEIALADAEFNKRQP